MISLVGGFLFAFITLGCLSRKSSSANLVGAGSVFGGICLARAFSCWREMRYFFCKSNLRCSAKISSADRCFLLIVLTCKAMRRSTSRHGADSDYSDSLALRRWRYSTSRFNAAVTNCPVLSPGIFTDSHCHHKLHVGYELTICFDLAFIAFLPCCILLNKRCDSVYTKKNHKKHLTCDSAEFNLNHTSVRGCKRQRPALFGAVTGRLTKPLTRVTIMAGTQHTPRLAHTQTAFHLAFYWH